MNRVSIATSRSIRFIDKLIVNLILLGGASGTIAIQLPKFSTDLDNPSGLGTKLEIGVHKG